MVSRRAKPALATIRPLGGLTVLVLLLSGGVAVLGAGATSKGYGPITIFPIVFVFFVVIHLTYKNYVPTAYWPL